MNQLKISDLEFHKSLSHSQQNVAGGIKAPSFSAQVSSGTVTKVVLDTDVSFQKRQVVYAYAAGYAGGGAVAASINGQATATIIVFSG